MSNSNLLEAPKLGDTIQVPKKLTLEVTLEHDSGMKNPLEEYDGQWSLYSWNQDRGNRAKEEDYRLSRCDGSIPWDKLKDSDFKHYPANINLSNKLRRGLAFWLRYSYDDLRIESNIDDRSICGILIWENKPTDMGAKTYEDRKKDAEACLEEYNNWANGHVYYYSVECTEAGIDDSCGGFIGEEHFIEEMIDSIAHAFTSTNSEFDPELISFEGDAAWLMDYNTDWKEKVKTEIAKTLASQAEKQAS